ncbi:MAG: DUF2188 domain-containing protein, partial [Cupriavidus sp.]|nr:DUF2188 domain-containing protein [Cupriavidus sp.]
MTAADIHVVPAGNEWAVEAAGGGDRTMFFTQEEAIASGIERVKRDKVDLLIHGPDGQIREETRSAMSRVTRPDRHAHAARRAEAGPALTHAAGREKGHAARSRQALRDQ